MKRLILFLFIILVSVGCNQSVSNNDNEEKASGPNDISVQEAQEMIQEGNVIVLDVRTPEEYEAGHIANSKLYPLQTLQEKLSELDKDKTYVVVCRSGNRSAEASQILHQEGFTSIYNMLGGMNEWTGEVVQ